MSDKAWKVFERSVAAALGTTRRLQLGRSTSDVDVAWAHVDCKYRKRHAVIGLFREAEKKYGGDGLPVVLVLKEARRPGAVVVMDFRDWLDLVKRAGLTEEAGADE